MTEKPKTFEQSLSRLEEILVQLDDGKTDLETALTRYEEGVGLLKSCHDILEKARRRIEILRNPDSEDSLRIETIDEQSFRTAYPGANS